MEEQAKKHFIINTVFILLWTGIIFASGKFLLSYLFPFLIALPVAIIMQKPAEMLSRKLHIKKGVCAAVLSAALYIFLAGILILIIFKLFSFTGKFISSISDLGAVFREIFDRLQGMIDSLAVKFSPDFDKTVQNVIKETIENVTLRLTGFVTDTASDIIKGIPSFLFSSIVALAATCYIAKDFDGLCLFVKDLLSKKTVDKLIIIGGIFKNSILKMLAGYVILAFITFLELLTGFWILGVKNALIISLVTAVIDILPVLGVGAVLIPWGILNIALGNGVLGVGLLVLYLIITIVRNFAEPKIVANRAGMNPLFILLAMFSGFKLLGVAGLIILPVTLIVIIKYYKNEMANEVTR